MIKFLKLSEIIPDINENKFFLFAKINKKSSLKFFWKRKKQTYSMLWNNYLSIKNIIKKLKDYTGLTSEIINMITENCNNNRIKLKMKFKKLKHISIIK